MKQINRHNQNWTIILKQFFFSNLNFLLGLLQNYMFFLRGTYETHIVDVFKWKKIMIEKQQKDLIEKLHAH